MFAYSQGLMTNNSCPRKPTPRSAYNLAITQRPGQKRSQSLLGAKILDTRFQAHKLYVLVVGTKTLKSFTPKKVAKPHQPKGITEKCFVTSSSDHDSFISKPNKTISALGE
eukprot:scaffold182428_cov31-Prasinocladus_malaysianus.AAC.2